MESAHKKSSFLRPFADLEDAKKIFAAGKLQSANNPDNYNYIN